MYIHVPITLKVSQSHIYQITIEALSHAYTLDFVIMRTLC